MDDELESFILNINFSKKEYSLLERLQWEGRENEVWHIVKKHLSNDRLVKYVFAFRQAQSRLSMAQQLVEQGEFSKFKTLLDEGVFLY